MSEENNILELESNIIQALKNVYDPEIPVNVYDLGLIYGIDVKEDNSVEITMTLTAPNCPLADVIVHDVQTYVKDVKGIKDVKIDLTFDPPWDKSLLSEEAKLELGML